MAQPPRAHDLNNAGQVCLNVDGTPVRYTPGVGLQPVGPYEPFRINDSGQMAGRAADLVSVGRYTDGIGWQYMGGDNNIKLRTVGGINAFGQVVATRYVQQHSSPPSYARYGFLLTDGLGAQDLNDLVTAAVLVRVKEVVGISDDGVIACEGSFGSDNRAMRLVPRFVTVSGSGCPGSGNRTPKALAAGVPAAGGRMALLAAQGRAGGAGVFLVGGQPANTPLPGGCTLLVDPAGSIPVGVALDPAGNGHVAFTLPAGTRAGAVHVQFASLDPQAANGVAAFSNAVRIDLQ